MDWVSVKDRLPEADMPVLMHEPGEIAWPAFFPQDKPAGMILLGIFKDGQFLADRPGDNFVRASHWFGPVVPPE